MSGDNYGLSIGGDADFHDANVAIGAHASVTNHHGSDPRTIDLHKQLADLIMAIEAAGPRLPHPETTAQETVQLRAEVAAEKPDKYKVAGLLASIATGVKTVSDLASRVAGIEHIVKSLIG